MTEATQSISEEVKGMQKPTNNVGKIWMIFSIIGLILVITVFLSWLWFICLFIGLILWIIGLFSKPRGKAITAVIIPVIILWWLIVAGLHIWNSFKTPAIEFADWLKWVSENPEYSVLFSEENEDMFENIIRNECSDYSSYFTADTILQDIENSKWNNKIEKFGYLIFGSVQSCMQNALDKYVNNEDINEDINEENNEEIIENTDSDIKEIIETIDNETTETLNEIEEQANIEEVLDILAAE